MNAPRILGAVLATGLLLPAAVPAPGQADDGARWRITPGIGALVPLGGEESFSRRPLLTCTVVERSFEGHLDRGVPGVQSSVFVATPIAAHLDLVMGAAYEYSGEIHDEGLSFDGLKGLLASVGLSLHL